MKKIIAPLMVVVLALTSSVLRELDQFGRMKNITSGYISANGWREDYE